jgi:peptidoglycan/LPS O-acetylase OafA/YrhL
MEAPLPRLPAWLASALGVGAAALLLRQWVPVGQSLIGLQIGYFASYIFLFAVGTVAWQRNWFERLTWKMARPWMILSVLMWPVLVIALLLARKATGVAPDVNTGFSVPAVEYALWEPLIAWGIIVGLLIGFREWGNRASAAWEFCSARAYAIYILHAPVLVGVALLFQRWNAPALVKVGVTGTLAVAASLILASALLLIPGARRVL